MAESAQNEQDEIEAAGPGGLKIRVRGYDILTIVMVVFGAAGVALLYQHSERTEQTMSKVAVSIDKLSQSNCEMACIISLPQEDRIKQFSSPQAFCKEICRTRMP